MDAPAGQPIPPSQRPRHSRRSILFCPGSRPERFPKALAAGADAVCLDLEDGVAPEARPQAREAVVGWLREGRRHRDAPGAPEAMVRVNHPALPDGLRDLEALAGLAPHQFPDALMVPKVDGPEPLETLLDLLTQGGLREPAPLLFPMIETAMGLHRVETLALAGLPVGALVFGGMDLAAELGARLEWEPLLHARSRLVHAAALAGVGVIDVPWPALDDPRGLEEEVRRATRLGFTGKLAIHPAQIPLIHGALAPDRRELEAARRVVDAASRSPGGVLLVDGRMVDRPVVLAAERVLARAGETPQGGLP